jgi:DNA-binding Lrp family transcriptional regulator
MVPRCLGSRNMLRIRGRMDGASVALATPRSARVAMTISALVENVVSIEAMRLSLFARVTPTKQDAEAVDRFIASMRRLPEVVECYIMFGESDALLRVVVADLDDYRRFHSPI